MVSKKEILAGLNPEQISAVTHSQGPLLVIAGAGTGKTTVITRRIAWLIDQKLARPGEILALTFTDKAADEMEARVDVLVPYGYVDVSISTFHAFGDRVLREHALDLGMRPDYRVLSRAEQIIFFREHLFDYPLHYYKSLGDPTKHIEALINVISRAKDEDVTPDEYLKWAKKTLKNRKPARHASCPKCHFDGRRVQGEAGGSKAGIKQQFEVAKVYKKYQELKMQNGFVDFGDQVNLALKLFREYPVILQEFQRKYKFILVDEFQDTNYAQFEMLKLLVRKRANITVVGDDDQSVYKFRGASISNILGFGTKYPKCKKVVLTNNYRSTQIILDTARRLIRHNDPERLEIRAGVDKRLLAISKSAGKKTEHRHFDKVACEADWVAQTVREKLEAKEYQLKDFAVLVRSNADAEPFRQSFNLLGIPYQFSGGGGLYVDPEVRLAAAFLKVIGDPSDSVSLYALSLSEVYRLNPLDLQKMNTFAARRNYTLHHVFTHLSEFEILADIREESREKAQKIMGDIQFYLEFARQKTTGEVLYQFLKKSGYLARLAHLQNAEAEYRLKNLAVFFEKIREFKEVAVVDRVAEFVKHLNILKEAGDDPASARPDMEADAVNILTVHKAKGLEFAVVFLVVLVSDRFPVRERKQPIELPDALVKEELPSGDFHLMEERRLFYVGMTRAKKELYLTSAVDYGGKRERKVSRFVLEALDIAKADIAALKKPALAQIELFAPGEPALLREVKSEIISLSHYQIDDYLTCPLKYKYIHVLRVPLLPNHQIIYGLALHTAVQAYFSARKDKQRFSEKQLLDTFAHNWSAEGFISRQHEEQRFAAGVLALKRFLKEERKRKRAPKYVEEEFTVLEDKIRVRGRWDLVAEEKGKTYIIDFKSSEVRRQDEADRRAKDSLQLSIYALAWRKMFGKLPDGLELQFIETGIIGRATKSEPDLEAAWGKIKTAASGLRAADYRARPNRFTCSYCPYNEICPSRAAA